MIYTWTKHWVLSAKIFLIAVLNSLGGMNFCLISIWLIFSECLHYLYFSVFLNSELFRLCFNEINFKASSLIFKSVSLNSLDKAHRLSVLRGKKYLIFSVLCRNRLSVSFHHQQTINCLIWHPCNPLSSWIWQSM